MDSNAQSLTLENLERVLRTFAEGVSTPINLKPTWMWAPPSHRKPALRLLGWLKGPVRKARGIRGRKRALYWRTTK